MKIISRSDLKFEYGDVYINGELYGPEPEFWQDRDDKKFIIKEDAIFVLKRDIITPMDTLRAGTKSEFCAGYFQFQYEGKRDSIGLGNAMMISSPELYPEWFCLEEEWKGLPKPVRSREEIVAAIEKVQANGSLTHSYREDVIAALQWVLGADNFDGDFSFL